jgi:hypothetical protein
VKEERKNDIQLLFGKRMDHPLSLSLLAFILPIK